MNEEKPPNGAPSAVTKTTVQVETPGKPVVQATATSETDIRNIPGLGKLYLALGLTGTLVCVFAYIIWESQSNATAAINNTQKLMEAQLNRLTTELSEARKDARADRQEMQKRYEQNREQTNQRHEETKTRLDKIILFIEMLWDKTFAERMKKEAAK